MAEGAFWPTSILNRVNDLVKHLLWNFLAKMVATGKPLTISPKNFIIDVWQEPKYAFNLNWPPLVLPISLHTLINVEMLNFYPIHNPVTIVFTTKCAEIIPCQNALAIQGRTQNLVKHLRWSILQSS